MRLSARYSNVTRFMPDIEARIVAGHGVASGRRGDDPRFPNGTIRPQLSWFRAAIRDFDSYLGADGAFCGTINLALPAPYRILAPDHRLAAVPWTDVFPPETFHLSRARLGHGGQLYPVFLYMPDPATKPDHIQAPDILELIGPPIADLRYGDAATLHVRAGVIAFIPGA